MNTRTCIFFMFFIVVILTSCVKSFVPDVEKYNELPVVDGAITDGPGPYTIKLSKSSRLRELSKFNPYQDCKVMIEDDLGNKTILSERGAGVYQTDSSTMQSVPGRMYKLTISTPEGETYESTPELLLKGFEIKSLYAELEHKSDPNLFYGRDGYQFYTDIETPNRADNYLLWRLQCTYKFDTDFSMYGYYDDGIHEVAHGDTLRTCYRTIDILNLYLWNGNELTNTNVKHIPLYYEDNYTKALFIRYSLKLTQLRIGKEAYNYWSEIKKMQDAGGDLYSQQPYQVRNNLTNLTHPEKPILGYFMAAGISEKRIFVDRPNVIFHLDSCQVPEIRYLFQKLQGRPDLWPIFLASVSGNPAWVEQQCVDCRVLGVQAKPSFWIE
jgi:hypothetical protein